MKLPPQDTHFKDPSSYQLSHYNTALAHTRKRRVAVDVGAHVGIHTQRLAQDFEQVIAIEPLNTQYLVQNTQHLANVTIVSAGASDKPCTLYAHNPTHNNTNSGAWELNTTPSDKPVEVITIDSLNLNDVDLIKIDTQGLEREVIEGARLTLQRCRPTVWIEDRGNLQQYMLEQHTYKNIDAYMKEHYYVYATATLTAAQARLLSYRSVHDLTEQQIETIWGNPEQRKSSKKN